MVGEMEGVEDYNADHADHAHHVAGHADAAGPVDYAHAGAVLTEASVQADIADIHHQKQIKDLKGKLHIFTCTILQ